MNQRKLNRFLHNLTLVAQATPRVANHKLAAAVIHKNRVVAYGVNSYKTSPLQKRYSRNEHAIFQHAEIAVIKNALRVLSLQQLSRSVMLICRVTSRGTSLARPCEGCQRALVEFGIRRVYYTVNGGLEQM